METRKLTYKEILENQARERRAALEREFQVRRETLRREQEVILKHEEMAKQQALEFQNELKKREMERAVLNDELKKIKERYALSPLQTNGFIKSEQQESLNNKFELVTNQNSL